MSQMEKEVVLRDKMFEEEPTEDENTRIDFMDRIQLLEEQNRKLLDKLR